MANASSSYSDMINIQRLTNILLLTATLVSIALPHTAPAQAEIPPGSYDKLRISAGEALIIKIEKVERRLSGNREFTTVLVKAKVVAVQRSKNGIKPGNNISIQYESRNPNSTMTGARRIAILQEGNYYPAFLNINDDRKNYSPAAYGESFTMTPEN
jgi:hypothetical protein